ncbi:MAG: TonB-dependent receptor plug domain-containing protein, partial [Muribaculaceae bacterium]|nr:TonB-dependent receptor plug domain-containing protein [Muribaculaceae bacterium]
MSDNLGVKIRLLSLVFVSLSAYAIPEGGTAATQADSLYCHFDSRALNEVVITATRTPKALKDVPVVTRVITAEELKKTDAANIQDLLTEELPGLEFGFAMTQETSLNMSGFGGSAVLFLIDGERLAGETMDNVDYNRLNLENVGQVEIVKGASSALYGANAVGGVVNLISREDSAPWRVNLNSRYNSFGNQWRTGGTASFNKGKWASSTTAQYSTSQTVRLTELFDTESKIHNIFGGNTLNLKERVTFRANDFLKFIARGGYFSRVSNRANYDDHYHDYNGGLRSVWAIDRTQNLELSYSYDQYDKSRYVASVRTHDHDYSNRQHIVHALYSKFWGENGLTAGADYMHDYLNTYQFTDNASHSQSTFDAFVQFDYN